MTERATEVVRRAGLAKHGRRGYLKNGPAGEGNCIYCGRWTRLTYDHVIPQAWRSGDDMHDQINLVRACRVCNVARAALTLKPPFYVLPIDTRAFVLARIGAERAAALFTGVPRTEAA